MGAYGIIGCYTDNTALIGQAVIPYKVMLLNYIFALPGYVYINAVTGTGNTRTACVIQVITIHFYLSYLYALSCCQRTSLTLYMTTEYLFVILLAVQSIIFLNLKKYHNYEKNLSTF